MKKQNNKKILKNKKTKVEPKKEFEKFIRSKIDLILSGMLIDFVKYNLHFDYYDDPYKNLSKNGQVNVFSIRFSKQYKSASINIMKPAFDMYKSGAIKDLTDGIVHELSHIHTIPLSDKAECRFVSRNEIMETSEELTETIAEYLRVILRNTKEDLYKK